LDPQRAKPLGAGAAVLDHLTRESETSAGLQWLF